jgi:hypothetical protein
LVLPAVKRSPVATVWIALLIQLVVAVAAQLLRQTKFGWIPFYQTVPAQLPTFLLGIVVSLRGDAIIAATARYRWMTMMMLLLLAGVTPALAALPHSVALGVLQEFIAKGMGACVIFWVFLSESVNSKSREWLNFIGLRSLGILLIHGYIVRAALVLLSTEKLPVLLEPRFSPSEPAWLFGHVLGMLPFFAAGLLLSLLAIELTERWAGKAVRTSIFG